MTNLIGKSAKNPENAVLDVKKFADGAENEPFEVPKRVGGMGRSAWRWWTGT